MVIFANVIRENMSRNILLLVSLLVLPISTWAQPKFAPDTDIKMVGEVAFQVPKTFTLGFTNKGDSPLSLLEVKASCGCMDVAYPKTPIAAGAHDEIQVTFDAKMLGTFYKELEVRTNASEEPTYMAMQGTVVREVQDYSQDYPIDLGNLRLKANTLEFDDVQRGDHPTLELYLVNCDRTAYRPELMHLPPYLSAEYVPLDIPAKKPGVIRLTLDSEKLEHLGLTQTSIYLSRYLGDKIGEANEIVVSAILLPHIDTMGKASRDGMPELTVSESNIDMGSMDGKDTRKQAIILTNTGHSDLHIQQVQVFNTALSVNIGNRVIRPGKSTKLKISVSARYLNKSKGPKHVMLITDAPHQTKQYINVEVTP